MSVYFITARDVDLVKIGCAYDPVARFNHLRTSSPIDLALEGAISGGFEKERELHARYAKWRVRGEWFTITPSIEREIDASTMPTKFTWAAVRLWLKNLATQSEAIEPQMAAEGREERVREACERVQQDLTAKARRAGMTQLQRLEADGAIHFPFRAREDA